MVRSKAAKPAVKCSPVCVKKLVKWVSYRIYVLISYRANARSRLTSGGILWMSKLLPTALRTAD
jgi:hypothetical protein